LSTIQEPLSNLHEQQCSQRLDKGTFDSTEIEEAATSSPVAASDRSFIIDGNSKEKPEVDMTEEAFFLIRCASFTCYDGTYDT